MYSLQSCLSNGVLPTERKLETFTVTAKVLQMWLAGILYQRIFVLVSFVFAELIRFPSFRHEKQNETPLGYTYTTETISPHVVLVPILRSGLGMLEGMSHTPPSSNPVPPYPPTENPLANLLFSFRSPVPSPPSPPPYPRPSPPPRPLPRTQHPCACGILQQSPASLPLLPQLYPRFRFRFRIFSPRDRNPSRSRDRYRRNGRRGHPDVARMGRAESGHDLRAGE